MENLTNEIVNFVANSIIKAERFIEWERYGAPGINDYKKILQELSLILDQYSNYNIDLPAIFVELYNDIVHNYRYEIGFYYEVNED